jgi:mRNA-degrading endonuclease toxin of MazEF toxin-antitoxin module
MPSEGTRTKHPQRPVVILSGTSTNLRPGWPLVLIVPCSTAEKWNTEFCIPIEKGQGGATEDTWARVPLIQPLLKTHLNNRLGRPLPSAKLDEIHESLASYMSAFGL